LFCSVDGDNTCLSCVPKNKFPMMIAALAASAIVVAILVLILIFVFTKKKWSTHMEGIINYLIINATIYIL